MTPHTYYHETNYTGSWSYSSRRRQDASIVDHAQGLKFLVFDEIHTYRGRQFALMIAGSFVVARSLFQAQNAICIGTSATMASGSKEFALDQERSLFVVAQTCSEPLLVPGRSMRCSRSPKTSDELETTQKVPLQHITKKYGDACNLLMICDAFSYYKSCLMD